MGQRVHDEPWTSYDDLAAVQAVMKRLAELYVPGDCFIGDGTLTIRNSNDYPVGWVWFDPEAEAWRFTAHREGVEP